MHLDDGNDDAKEADGAAKDLDDEDLDEKRGALGIGESGAAGRGEGRGRDGRLVPANNADTDAAEEVAQPRCDTAGEDGVSCDCDWRVLRMMRHLKRGLMGRTGRCTGWGLACQRCAARA